MRRVKIKPTGGGKYRFRFLGMPMTFSKLQEHFQHKTSTDRLKAAWMRRGRPFEITDPEFFASAFIIYARNIEIVGKGVFPSAVAIAREFGIPINVVRSRIRTLGTRLHLSDLEFDQRLHAQMVKYLEKRRVERKKARLEARIQKNKNEYVAKRPRGELPSDEWLAFSDRPRSTQPGGFHTSY